MADAEEPRLAAILLAAGGSGRLGQPKQLVSLHGESLVRRTASLLLDLGAAPIVVVTGHCSEMIVAQLHDFSLRVVHNETWEAGMGYSIACGANEILESVDGVMLVLCDQWMLRKTDYMTLLTAWKTDISQIVISEWQVEDRYITGPPVIFPGKLLPELKYVKGETGAKAVINRNSGIVCRIALQNAVFDLDNPRDLARLKNPGQ